MKHIKNFNQLNEDLQGETSFDHFYSSKVNQEDVQLMFVQNGKLHITTDKGKYTVDLEKSN